MEHFVCVDDVRFADTLRWVDAVFKLESLFAERTVILRLVLVSRAFILSHTLVVDCPHQSYILQFVFNLILLLFLFTLNFWLYNFIEDLHQLNAVNAIRNN